MGPKTLSNSNAQIVSSDSESLILVDSHDEPLGHLDKGACHDGDGILHRAFSLFIFNGQGELLLQQRAADKRLWPLYWSNSCCSHPREGESMEIAVERRLEQELGFRTSLEFIYKFEYQARFKDLGAEHELCSVFIGHYDGEVAVNPTEVAAWRWQNIQELTQQMNGPNEYTPWFNLEWAQLREEYADKLPA